MEWKRGGRSGVRDGSPTSDEGLRIVGDLWMILTTFRVSGCSGRAQKTAAIARYRAHKYHDCTRCSRDRVDAVGPPRILSKHALTPGKVGW